MSPNGVVYTYTEKDGYRKNGAYTIFINGSLTYEEAKAQLQDIIDSGFLMEETFMYLSIEMLTYNPTYKNGGVTRCEYVKKNDGVLYTYPAKYFSIFPQNYDE